MYRSYQSTGFKMCNINKFQMTLAKMSKMKNTISNVDKDMEKLEL